VVGGAVRGGKVGSGVGICDMEGTRETDGWRESVGGTVVVGELVGKKVGVAEGNAESVGGTVVVVGTSVSEKVGVAEGNEVGIIISDDGRVVGICGMVRGVKFGEVVMSMSLGALVDGVFVGTVVGIQVVVLEGMEVGNDDGNRTIAEGSSDGVDDSTDS